MPAPASAINSLLSGLSADVVLDEPRAGDGVGTKSVRGRKKLVQSIQGGGIELLVGPGTRNGVTIGRHVNLGGPIGREVVSEPKLVTKVIFGDAPLIESRVIAHGAHIKRPGIVVAVGPGATGADAGGEKSAGHQNSFHYEHLLLILRKHNGQKEPKFAINLQ